MLKDYKNVQPVAYKVLSNSVDKNRFNHAYLFETNGYEDGLNMAINFAKAILCPNSYLSCEKCGNCSQCKTIDDNNYPELKIINPDGLWIKKEQLIDLQEEFSKKSIIGNKKIYIINHAEKLNVNSSNTILKFIEEPPNGIIAILVTDNIYQLLDTIISRCQIISLNGQANISINDSTISKIGKFMSNTVLEYEDFMANDNEKKIEDIIKFINYYEKNGKKILLYMNEFWFDKFSDKEAIYDALQIVVFFYKDCLNFKIGCEIEVFNDYKDDIEFVSNNNDLNNIIKKLKIINDNKYFINNNANLNLLMDKIIIELEEGV